MNPLLLFFAQVGLPEVEPWQSSKGNSRELAILFGAIALLTSVLVIWAVYLRKKRRSRHRHHRHHHDHSQSGPATENPASTDPAAADKPRRRRRRRRDHRPMNPTLAQTGGLPPVRQEQPPTPSAPE